jgi:hypothetical protein
LANAHSLPFAPPLTPELISPSYSTTESINGVETSGKIFVATYMLFFSTLLFMFEMMDIRPIEWFDHMLRRNFGFLYGTLGKSLFIIL